MAWQFSLALKVEADDACTAMRLGERMTNHVWGIFSELYAARNAMGTVLYSEARDSKNKKNFNYKLKRNTSRKAKYKPIFTRYCIGFFCIAIVVYQPRAPPLHDFLQKEIMEGKDMLNDFRGRDFWIINKENKTIYYLRLNGSWMQVTKEVYSIYKSSYQKMYREYQRDKDAVEFNEYVESKYVKEANPLEFIVFNEMKDRLEKAIHILSDDEIRIIQAYFYDEQSERQIAEKLGISKTALHYKKTKILEKLKKFIDQ